MKIITFTLWEGVSFRLYVDLSQLWICQLPLLPAGIRLPDKYPTGYPGTELSGYGSPTEFAFSRSTDVTSTDLVSAKGENKGSVLL